LSLRELKVFVISGNHDSGERIAFASRIMQHRGIYMSPVYSGKIEPISIEDEYGTVEVYLLPFIKPAHVRRYIGGGEVVSDEDSVVEINSYTDAVRYVIDKMDIDSVGDKRNILVTHQFVTGASRSESEDISVGGSDNVDANVFLKFDYVALGHIHKPQNIGKDTIRYCGTPLKYSFSEASHTKSVTIVELKEKGNTVVKNIPLIPRQDMREIKGMYMEVVDKGFYSTINKKDYMHITLTDEEDIPDAIVKLRSIYPNIMKLDYDNTRTRANMNITGTVSVEKKQPIELFKELYELQNNKPLSEEQDEFLSELIDKLKEEK